MSNTEIIQPIFDALNATNKRKISMADETQNPTPNPSEMFSDEEIAAIQNWYEMAEDCTTNIDLTKLSERLLGDFKHTPFTLPHAASALTLGGLSVVLNSEHGELAQQHRSVIAGTIVGELLRFSEEPIRLVRLADILFPDRIKDNSTIPAATWAWLQGCAKLSLEDAKENPSPNDPVEHWQSIVDGKVPEGFTVV